MDNFQRLLETPFRWFARLGGGLPDAARAMLARRHQQALRRKYMNG